MKKSRFSGQQVIGILKQAEAVVKVADLCQEHGISPATYYTNGKSSTSAWKRRKWHGWLRAQGKRWNRKRVARVYRALKLNLRIHPCKRLLKRIVMPLADSRLPLISAGQWIL